MITDSVEAWLLHKRPSGETSVQLSLLTKEWGLIHCLYKGGRTLKKRSFIEPFTPLWLHCSIKKGSRYLRQIENTTNSIPLQTHPLFAALYLNELLFCLLKAEEPLELLYENYVETLRALSLATVRSRIEFLLRIFERKLLACLGYAINFTEEAQGNSPIVADKSYQFLLNEGFVLAEQGLLGQHILDFYFDKLDNMMVLKTAKFIMRRAIDHLLDGKTLKTRALYSSLKTGI